MNIQYPRLILLEHIRTEEFKIHRFKDSRKCGPYRFLPTTDAIGVCINVQDKGVSPENTDYLTFHIKNFHLGHVSVPRMVIYFFTLSVLDVNGEKKFPRTFKYRFRADKIDNSCYISEDIDIEERYIERNFILNNEFEYLQKGTLTVHVESTLKGKDSEWGKCEWNLAKRWSPMMSSSNFQVKELENGLEVYLHPALHFTYLIENSSVFKDMVQMLESQEENIKLEREELPAFLCVLYFIETKKLVLYGATILDLYKIADKYDIQIMLEQCRKYIEKDMSLYASAILDFAIFYYDTELEKTARSYLKRQSHDKRRDDISFENGNETGDFIYDTNPVSSNLIKTVKDFEDYLRNLWGKIVENDDELCFSEEQPSTRSCEMKECHKSFDFYK